jgi:flotillin
LSLKRQLSEINKLKVAEFRREQDIAKARADQAYGLETARSKQDVTGQEMQIRIIEFQKQIELGKKSFAVKSTI